MTNILKPKYEQIIIFCPPSKTGGPEALHQLCSSINQLGGVANILYISSKYDIQVDDGYLVNPLHQQDIHNYENYNLKIIKEDKIKVDEKTLIIIPEIWAYENLKVPENIQKCIWWLSVDYSTTENLNFLNEKKYLNFYQSEYANNYLTKNNIDNRFPLFDYVNINADKTKYYDEKNIITYFPNKGGTLARKFISRYEWEYVAIQNMTRPEVDSVLSQCAIYIDFGHQPGKDRIPREASISGAVILLQKKGSVEFFKDHPLGDEYLFTEEDVLNGNLNDKVEKIMHNRSFHFEKQSEYRKKIEGEEVEFYNQVKSLFFTNN